MHQISYATHQSKYGTLNFSKASQIEAGQNNGSIENWEEQEFRVVVVKL
jgi:hypothetical protein